MFSIYLYLKNISYIKIKQGNIDQITFKLHKILNLLYNKKFNSIIKLTKYNIF